MKIKTFIVTRFNLPLKFEENKNGVKYSILKDGYQTDILYLTQRMELFKQFTFPSVKGQTDQDFSWLCLFSEHTPLTIRNEVCELKKSYSNFTPMFLTDKEGINFEEFLTSYIRKKLDHELLITIRLDNDDAISKRYIEQVRKYVIGHQQCDYAINFLYGINFYLERNVIKTRYAENNHFYALVSNKDSEYIHPFMFSHVNLNKKINVINLGSKEYPMWIEVIHDSNFSNGTSKTLMAQKILSGYSLNLQNIDEKTIIWV